MKNSFKLIIIFASISLLVLIINYLLTPINLISNGFKTEQIQIIDNEYHSEDGDKSIIFDIENNAKYTIYTRANEQIQNFKYSFKDGVIEISSNLKFICTSATVLFELNERIFYYETTI